MRHRIEDLGRLLVLIDQALESELFDDYFKKHNWLEYYLPADCQAPEYEVPDDIAERHLTLRKNIESLRDKLYEAREIALGTDWVNGSVEDDWEGD